MLSPKTQYNLKNAKEYFEEHLCIGDYYSEGEHISGKWIGKGAERLGLSGHVGRDEFIRLCENLHLQSGELLTQRKKTTRLTLDEEGNDVESANRRVFYDFTISPPKDVSILALLGGDHRIVAAHDQAVQSAVSELEQFAATRVRRAGGSTDRETGNIVGAVFQHDTSRSLDPHLHSHCIFFNATYDVVEDRWKALQNYEMLRAQKFVENVYYHELARALGQCGYQVENRTCGDFVIRGVSDELRNTFSKRHAEIDQKTRDLLAREPEMAAGNVADIREHIAHNERSRKIRDITGETLSELWKGQLTKSEGLAVANLVADAQKARRALKQASADGSLAWAEDHLFERKSVVREHELWRHALEHARGCELDVSALKQESARRPYIRELDDPCKVTTRETMGREWDVLQLAKSGIGKCEPLNAEHRFIDPALDEDQRKAVHWILNSRDFLTLFRGGAGTGKSFALREVWQALQTVGHSTCVIAPQRQQVISLERDGLGEAQTVSEFLARKNMKHGAVVILDEAGQLGARQMQALLRYVRERGGRLIASGDTRQHGAVEASDALRAIERYSGLQSAELHEIRRQDPQRAATRRERKFIEEYRRAVKDAANGHIPAAFDRLNAQGAVVECTPADQQDRLAHSYVELASNGRSTVVVSQTWSEIHKVNEAVRALLQARGVIGGNGHAVVSLERMDLTNAQKLEGRFYTANTLLVFNRDCGRFRKGDTAQLVVMTDKGIFVEAEQKSGMIATRQLDHVTVCRKRELHLVPGDRIQLKANGQAADGRRVANGELVTIDRVESNGRILLRDGRTLGSDYRQFVRGYAVTSYASQGKTVDYVLFSDSAVKAATNRQQWYVTISRGRRGIKIFTSDPGQLREHAARSGDRELALDLRQQTSVRRVARWRLLRGIVRGRRSAVELWRSFRRIIIRRTPGVARRAEV